MHQSHELLRLSSALPRGLAIESDVRMAVERCAPFFSRDGNCSSSVLAQPTTASIIAPAFELALKMWCDDPMVVDRMRNLFVARSAELLDRAEEAIHERAFKRAALEVHSLRGMALYMDDPAIAVTALALEQEASAAHEKLSSAPDTDGTVTEAAARSARRRLRGLKTEIRKRGLRSTTAACAVAHVANDVRWLSGSGGGGGVRDGGGGMAELGSDTLVDAMARRSIRYAIEHIMHAAVREELDMLRVAASGLKQMALCHGPFFDLLAIASYR